MKQKQDWIRNRNLYKTYKERYEYEQLRKKHIHQNRHKHSSSYQNQHSSHAIVPKHPVPPRQLSQSQRFRVLPSLPPSRFNTQIQQQSRQARYNQRRINNRQSSDSINSININSDNHLYSS